MARLTSFMLCESITNMPAANMSVVPTLIAPQTVLRPQFVPGNFSFGVAVGISDVDLHVVNKVRFTITNPEGTVVQEGISELPVSPEDSALPEQYHGFMMCIDIRNLAVSCEGEFIFEFFVNDESVGEERFPIFKKGM